MPRRIHFNGTYIFSAQTTQAVPASMETRMVTSSKHLKSGNFARCAFCNEPFVFRDGHVEVWRASNGEHFCSEFCADDAEEAQFRKRHPATSSFVGLR
jgi:hypothetical protein